MIPTEQPLTTTVKDRMTWHKSRYKRVSGTWARPESMFDVAVAHPQTTFYVVWGCSLTR